MHILHTIIYITYFIWLDLLQYLYDIVPRLMIAIAHMF